MLVGGVYQPTSRWQLVTERRERRRRRTYARTHLGGEQSPSGNGQAGLSLSRTGSRPAQSFAGSVVGTSLLPLHAARANRPFTPTTILPDHELHELSLADGQYCQRQRQSAGAAVAEIRRSYP